MRQGVVLWPSELVEQQAEASAFLASRKEPKNLLGQVSKSDSRVEAQSDLAKRTVQSHARHCNIQLLGPTLEPCPCHAVRLLLYHDESWLGKGLWVGFSIAKQVGPHRP